MIDTKPTIEEQMLQAQRNVKSAAFYESNLDVEKAILASLKELSANKLAKEHYWENEAKRYAGNAEYWRERAEKAEADNQRLRKDCDEHARWRADLADKLHDAEAELGAAQNSDEHNFNRWQKAEAELAALRLELARLDGEIPYGN